MKIAFLCFLILAATGPLRAAEDLSAMPTEKLVDELTDIDAQAPGLHSTALVRGFIAEDKPFTFGGGVMGSTRPVVSPPMRELARRGVAALPQLIAHLNDNRPTKLTVGSTFFMFRKFGDEYDPKTRPVTDAKTKVAHDLKNQWRKDFTRGYTVKVGDVCYAIIGQIVNRNLYAIRYQPSAGLIVNSPIEMPDLIDQVKNDWGTVDAPALEASLVADAQAGKYLFDFGPALERLRFYYPDDYAQLKEGALRKKIVEFEADEKHNADASGKSAEKKS